MGLGGEKFNKYGNLYGPSKELSDGKMCKCKIFCV
jgi:hypothetical protein